MLGFPPEVIVLLDIALEVSGTVALAAHSPHELLGVVITELNLVIQNFVTGKFG